MHGKGGDGDEEIALRRPGADLPVLLHDQPPRDFQRPVEEGVPEPAAVRLGVEAGVRPRHLHGVLLDFQRRGIGVRSDDAEGEAVEPVHGEGDDRASSPHDEVFSALRKRPVLRFGEGDESVFKQERGGVFRRVVGGERIVEKFGEFVGHT